MRTINIETSFCIEVFRLSNMVTFSETQVESRADSNSPLTHQIVFIYVRPNRTNYFSRSGGICSLMMRISRYISKILPKGNYNVFIRSHTKFCCLFVENLKLRKIIMTWAVHTSAHRLILGDKSELYSMYAVLFRNRFA